jgi:hypothetical protein
MECSVAHILRLAFVHDLATSSVIPHPSHIGHACIHFDINDTWNQQQARQAMGEFPNLHM